MELKPKPDRPRHLHWKRKRLEVEHAKRAGTLTPEEQACTLVALKYLVFKYGNVAALAFKMGVDRAVLRRAMKGAPPPGVAIALELARVAGVTVDDVLAGRFPAPGECPMCGGTRVFPEPYT